MTGIKLTLNKILALCLATLTLCQLSACGGSGGSGSSAPTGTLKVAITDMPSNSYASVVVAVREVRVVPAGMDNAADNDPGLPVVVHFDTPRVIDVMQLRFVQQTLGEIVLPAGTYSQIRLILEPNPNGQGQAPLNYLTLQSAPNTKIALTTPSAQQSGLKVLGPLQVKPGVINAVTIDFDPNTAIVARGNGGFNLKPTGIRMVQTTANLAQFATIGGTFSTSFKDWSSATVSVKRRGAVNDVDPIAAGKIFSNYTSGQWQAPFTAFVPASTQTVSYKAFISANGFRLYSSQAVPALQGQLTDLGVIQPIPGN